MNRKGVHKHVTLDLDFVHNLQNCMNVSKHSSVRIYRLTRSVTNSTQPQKLPLAITLSKYVSKLSDEKLHLVQSIQKLLENEAFIWGEFPISVPESRMTKESLNVTEVC